MYITTTNQNLAMQVGYIGEMIIHPDPVIRMMRWVFNRQHLLTIHFYYAGKPDDRLKELFDYDDEAMTKDGQAPAKLKQPVGGVRKSGNRGKRHGGRHRR